VWLSCRAVGALEVRLTNVPYFAGNKFCIAMIKRPFVKRCGLHSKNGIRESPAAQGPSVQIEA
jgi:hypothetical protein